jgi:predicted double-glycine peptidase
MPGGARRRALVVALGATVAIGCAHGSQGWTAQPVTAPADGRGWVVVPGMKALAQTGDADCGPAALTMALARWGATPSPDAWRPRPGEDRARDGVSAGALRDEARRAGFQSYVFEGTFEDLAAEIAAGRPVIVGLVRVEHEQRTAHFTVIVGHDARARRWLLADPALGVRAITAEALRDDWARAGWVTLVVFPNAEARPVRASA